jgi:hypothetical protein
MAIDLREQQATRAGDATGVGTGPAPTAPHRARWPFALALMAVLAVTGAIAVFTTLEEPAPAGVTMPYSGAAFTAQREGGTYAEQPVAGAAFTAQREGGTYVDQPEG